MNKTELKKNWNKVLSLLPQDQMTRIRIDTWFRPLQPYRLHEEGGVIYFSSPDGDNFTAGLVRRNENMLGPAVEQVFGRPYRIEVRDQKETEEPAGDIPEEGGFFNPRYSFENFVSGPNNRLAVAVCLAVADEYSREYNPLFIYGGSGLGKTHLLHAIGQEVRRKHPEKRILYISSEAFVNEYVNFARTNKMEEFREKYRKLDILLFDDVQFIAGKKETENELFHTFDSLYNAGKQVVFVSDKPPKELGDIPERLITRFQMGMIADIQPPDYETRKAILIKKAEQEALTLDPDMMDVLDIIAQNIPSNIRELEGALNRVVAQGALTGEKITKQLVRKVLTEVFHTKSSEITPTAIKKEVANYFGIKVSEIESSKRSRYIAYPRQIAIYLIRKHTNLSLPRIGEEFGGRDHTTILHSYDKISEEIRLSEDLRKTVDILEHHLTEEFSTETV